ncbi:Plant transposase (Ptta/En/Spm family) [Carex littledalei]|uniref:Plant transposase (Ptta/En/Spm family) n=1 Tax=Carex littledalei TaxID=544730 RepID=A0A833RHG9_9POAL|nr:Plant transposase (Ptta/En/Spm family) [Carex littledalei]
MATVTHDPPKSLASKRLVRRPKPLGADIDGRRRSPRLKPVEYHRQSPPHPTILTVPIGQPSHPPLQTDPLASPPQTDVPLVSKAAPPQPGVHREPVEEPVEVPVSVNEAEEGVEEPVRDRRGAPVGVRTYYGFNPYLSYLRARNRDMDSDSDQSEESEEILSSEDIDMDRDMYTIEEETEKASAESQSDPSQIAEPETAEAPTSARPRDRAASRAANCAAREETAGVQSLPPEIEDDGSRRFRKRRVLRMCPEALELSGVDLDWSADKVQIGKRKRNKKGKKSDVKGVRGLAKPREPVQPDRRPALKVVGDYEFTAAPECSKVVTTIRLLTCECMPGPIRSYNMFPSRVRLEILRKFLQRYSWAEGEDVGRCLDVFENIAADGWGRVLVDARRVCRKKFGEDKELWKEFCPRWCKNSAYWKGLCDIWMNPKWEQSSNINRANKTGSSSTGDKRAVSHVGGSRSSYRHKQKLIVEKGSAVGLQDVFDRTHLKRSPAGEYVSDRAKRAADRFKSLKEAHGNEMDDEALWKLAVDGEDKRGRLYGFGNRSRMSKANQEVEAMEASPSMLGM